MASKVRGRVYSARGKVITNAAIREGRIPAKMRTASGKPISIEKVLEKKAYRDAVSPAIKDRIEYLGKRRMRSQADAFLRFAAKHPQTAQRVAQNLQSAAAAPKPQSTSYFNMAEFDLVDFEDEVDEEWLYY